MKLLIKNGRVINPATNIDEVMDVLVVDGIVEKLEKNINDDADKIIGADKC